MSPPPPTAHLKKGFALQLRTFSNLCLRQIAVAATSPLQGKGHLFYNFGYSLTALCAAAAAIRRRYFGCCTFLCISVSSLSLTHSLTPLASYNRHQEPHASIRTHHQPFRAHSLSFFLSFLHLNETFYDGTTNYLQLGTDTRRRWRRSRRRRLRRFSQIKYISF